MKEIYPKELFHLIIEYAKKKAILSKIDFLESVKTNTPIYYLIGNYDWNITDNSSYWNELVSRYNKGENLVDIAYSMQITNYKDLSKNQKWFGCFRYKHVEDKNGDEIVKMHFSNNDTSGKGPLAISQMNNRLSELKLMFEDIKNNYPNTKYVQGGSWLYNIESYTRLFPKSYLKDMESIKPKPSVLVIWGQFVDSEWRIKNDSSERFLQKVKEATTLEELDKSFELVELFPKGEIFDFYSYYNID